MIGVRRWGSTILEDHFTSMMKSSSRTPNPVMRERYLLDVPFYGVSASAQRRLKSEADIGAIPGDSTIFIAGRQVAHGVS